jgi:RNA polymerase sigma-70 factor (ECF subfamily)
VTEPLDGARAARRSDFDAFYRREYPALAVLATAVSGDPGSGEDIAQEALHRAQQRWAVVSGHDKPGAWTRRVAINLATSRRRRLASEARALLRLDRARHGGPSAEAAALHGDPEVWRAVAELPPRQRSVVALHYLEDRPVAEIAEVLGISVSATTSNLAKARRRLAQRLAPPSPTSAAPPEGDLR